MPVCSLAPAAGIALTRPLPAATDAYCLVAVYEELRRLLERRATTPQEVLRCIVTNTPAGQQATKPKQKKPAPPAPRVSQSDARGRRGLGYES